MSMLEIWCSIDEAPYFTISNYGRVQNLLTGELVEQLVDEDDEYLAVTLVDDQGRPFFVPIDVLVVEAFLGPIDGLENIIHIDEDPWNNEVWNLEVYDAYWRCGTDDCE